MASRPVRTLVARAPELAARTVPLTVRAVRHQPPAPPLPVRDTSLRVEPWRLFAAPEVVVLRDPDPAELSGLPAGTRVAVVTDRPLARRALRTLVAAGGLAIERELVALPSTRRPLLVLDDDEVTVRFLWQALALVPPGVRRQAAATLLLASARRLPWPATGALAPGRVLLGRKS